MIIVHVPAIVKGCHWLLAVQRSVLGTELGSWALGGWAPGTLAPWGHRLAVTGTSHRVHQLTAESYHRPRRPCTVPRSVRDLPEST